MSALSDVFKSVTEPFRTGDNFTKEHLKGLYDTKLPSFVSMLPYSGYDKETKTFILEDLVSRAVSLTLLPIATEGRTGSQLATTRDAIQSLYDELEEREKGRWVLQEFTYEDNSVDAIIQRMRDYVLPHAKGTVFTEQYINLMMRHFKTLQKEDGLYHDTKVTNQPWRFKMPRTKLILYRRQTESDVRNFSTGRHSPVTEINEVIENFKVKMSQAGIKHTQDDDIDLFTWLFKFFNPKPDKSIFENKEDYYERMCDIDSDLLTGRALREALLSDQPRSDVEDNCWYFNEKPMRFLRFSSLRKAPRIGALTGEVSSGEGANETNFCVMDALPSSTILAKTIVFTPQPEFDKRFRKTAKSAESSSKEAQEVKANFASMSDQIGTDQKKLQVTMGVYITGDDLLDLETNQRKTLTVLNNAGLMLYKDKVDGLSLKAFVNHLPMNFRPEQDKGYYLRSMWAQHCANLSFAFSRGEGTGNPCFTFFNRSGSPVFFDPFSKLDHEATGFGMILGSTGSGKSVTIANLVTSLAAMRRPRTFIIEYGDSFVMAAKDWAMKGLSVNYIKVMPETAPRLAPFSKIDKILDDIPDSDLVNQIEEFDDIDYVDVNDKEDKKDVTKQGDTISELELVLLLMATGSEESELARYTRADRSLLRRALVDTAKRQRQKGLDEGLGKAKPTVVSDIIETIEGYVRDTSLDIHEQKRIFLKDIALSLEAFTTGINDTLFNQPAEAWPDTDITVFNLGLLSQDGNAAQLNVAVLSLMQHINNLSEAYQYESRDVVSFTDEAHLLLNNQVLGKILTRVVKTARKLGHNPFFATQDCDDLKGESAKILNNIEWFYCLNFRQKEARKIQELCSLSDEDVHLMVNTRKQDKAYTEGVVISPHHRIMFRNTPPSLILAQAQTDKSEKAARTKYMRENGITDELEAVYEIANKLDSLRGIEGRIDYQEIKQQCAA
ncbi:conjugative transfer ATPase [Vibrio sp. THAF190c]|uniref:conjugative transfer ATPase n=1 Tax=Vibrio sp. THAF190c TaxID=2587865 RepID=UPI001268C177|nr:conjugative transfer ATPase [Vibrio sp. THAF190c]QFT13411.1 F pilus assembly Type-IV secretion system for plasmid transfer [Vibrio sp. THAF190c]